ncbi:hypothetical protein NT239_09795 [Chitinibacter sp. SCUT-21]|uniref:hypothetical protein n=1 Tax=Chitinibacter sp. SCUT-21 TaxID=2970891 RepID=UPI0035A74326
MRIVQIIIASVCALALTQPALAGCKKEIKETRELIERDKDQYTLVARNKALADLLSAEAKLIDLNPLLDLDCLKMVRKAKAELRKGKKK